jgi:hypothetical protein
MSSNNNTRRPSEYDQTDGDIEEAPRLHRGNVEPSATNEHFSVSARSPCGWDAYPDLDGSQFGGRVILLPSDTPNASVVYPKQL